MEPGRFWVGVHKYLDLDLDFAARRRRPLRARARAPHAGGGDGGGGGDGVDRLRGCVVRASPPCTNHTHRTNPAHHLLRPRARARPSCLPSRRRAAASNARGPSEADSPGIPFPPTHTSPPRRHRNASLRARAHAHRAALGTIRAAQALHGVRHGDYRRYRCAPPPPPPAAPRRQFRATLGTRARARVSAADCPRARTPAPVRP